METVQSNADADAVADADVPLNVAALVSALGGGLPDGRLVADRDVLAAMSHDDAEWAPVGRAVAGVRASTEAEVTLAGEDVIDRLLAECRGPLRVPGADFGAERRPE